MYSKETTKNEIEQILKQHNLNIDVIPENDKYEISFSKSKNAIRFNQYRLMDLYNKFKNIEPEFVLTIAVYHEIGHYIYYQRHPINNDDRKTKEEYAWIYGRELAPKGILLWYDTMKKFITMNP